MQIRKYTLTKNDMLKFRKYLVKYKAVNFYWLQPLFVLFQLWAFEVNAQTGGGKTLEKLRIDLAGVWSFKVDSLNEGISQQWFSNQLIDKIKLPGSMTTNGKGNDITLKTPWTGGIVDSSWFFKPEYAKYRQSENIKIPFWLQPVKYYKGAAWYQKVINIPASWKGMHLELYIERSHWETTVWLDDKPLGMQNSLGTAHIFDLSSAAVPGQHRLTILVDNRVKDINVGQNSHSITDHTQSNWNGMIGQLYIAARPSISIDNVQLYPDIKNKQVVARLEIHNRTRKPAKARISLSAISNKSSKEKLSSLVREVKINKSTTLVEAIYPMGRQPLAWNEFHPATYKMNIKLNIDGKQQEEKQVRFGMRNFSTRGTQFTINGTPIFLRGTLECAIFPKTGYPPTDIEPWLRIFRICKHYGLNHVRFHSWCPPEAAFDAADQLGFYLQVECSSWANQDAVIGDGRPLDSYIYEESNRIVKAYGNHPSFCMMAYGNEPAGVNHVSYLTNFVKYWKAKDSRRIYTTASGWPVVAENNYNSTPDPRIQSWGQGLKSIINSQPPRNDYDWARVIAKWQHPTVSHEIGQWCVYPDLKEITKYDGVLKAKNFEIFRDRLADSKLSALADSFLLASGKLQVLCYKADIEAALRTPGFGGFQLLDLHDFPGQGTALVGVLNPFWEDKGYVTGKEYSRFCNATVPLVRLPKMVYLNTEVLIVPVEVAHFGSEPLKNITPKWTLKNDQGKIIYSGNLVTCNIPIGNAYKLGEIRQSLSASKIASQLKLTVSVGRFENSWDLFVYPTSLPPINEEAILVTRQLDTKAMEKLNNGGSVLVTIKKGSIKDAMGGNIAVGFSSIFWNTAWTKGQAPTTLGILCNPRHPSLKDFPTEYYSNWQWWDAMSNSNVIKLDSVSRGLKPIVRVIDDWFTARSTGLVFECKIGKGKLLFSAIDLISDADTRPEARQLLYSFKKYMASQSFQPQVAVAPEKISRLFRDEPGRGTSGSMR